MPKPHPLLRPLALAVMSQLALLGAPAMAQQAGPEAQVLAEPTLDIRNYSVEGVNPLSEDETGQMLRPFTGDKARLSQIEQAALALEKALRSKGYIFHRVFVPVQKPMNGEVRLQIIRFTIGRVDVVGNDNFSTENIRRSLPTLVEGSVPDIHEVGQDLTAANTNPAKQVGVTFRESANPDAVDAVLKVKDSDPLTYFMGYTGNLPAEPKNPDDSVSRINFGLQHANLFDRDHVASVTYTTDPSKPDKVSLWGLYYQFPIYGRGLNLSAYHSSSDVNSGLGSLGLPDVTGKGQFTGARVTFSVPRAGPLLQTLGVALDDRHFDQGLPGTAVGSFPLSAKYTVRRDENWGGAGAYVEYAGNTAGGTDNTTANYNAQLADFDWQAWRLGLDGSYRAARWTFVGRLRAQFSNSRLIAGEKLSLGGAASVRGFTDAIVRGDNGYFVTLEANGPEMLLPQLRPLVFVDGGQVQSNDGVTANDALTSVGAGLRWSYGNLDLSADLAYITQGPRAEKLVDSKRLHIAAFYRF
jgi:hemolysin activation/secretion protein